MKLCQAVKKSKRICGQDASYQQQGFDLCPQHMAQYKKGKTLKVRRNGQQTKIRKEVEDVTGN